MNPKYLSVILKDFSPVSFPLIKDSVEIGCDPGCDIYLSDPSISRNHARLFRKEGEFWIEDTLSTNGTYLNGKKLDEPKLLVGGDKILMGVVEVRFGSPIERRKTITKELSLNDNPGYFVITDDSPFTSLSFFYRLGDALSCFSNEEELLARFAAIFNEYFNAEYVGYYLFRNADNTFKLEKWFRGKRQINPTKFGLEIDRDDCEKALKGTAYLATYENDLPSRHDRIFLPLRIGGKVSGFVVCIANKFATDYLSAFVMLQAKLMGSAIERVRNINGNLDASRIYFGSSESWIGDSAISRQVIKSAGKYALGDSPVVIYGESGTGKELIAKFIHWLSDRQFGPFVAFNCAAINERLAESELFGHVKGAFTDAAKEHVGLLEQANNGVIFLDEISELSLAMQAKLLRAIETKKIRRVGDSKDTQCSFRILCATNKILNELVKEGKFRADLFYRINVLTIELPSLKERREDIPLLLSFFIEKAAKKLNQDTPKIPSKTLQQLMNYSWPGNVRELKNSTERAVYARNNNNPLKFDDFGLTDSGIEINDLQCLNNRSLNESIELLEKQIIQQKLITYRWNKTRTATALSITRQTLDRKIELYDLNKKNKED